jgi:hypothetical protein
MQNCIESRPKAKAAKGQTCYEDRDTKPFYPISVIHHTSVGPTEVGIFRKSGLQVSASFSLL